MNLLTIWEITLVHSPVKNHSLGSNYWVTIWSMGRAKLLEKLDQGITERLVDLQLQEKASRLIGSLQT